MLRREINTREIESGVTSKRMVDDVLPVDEILQGDHVKKNKNAPQKLSVFKQQIEEEEPEIQRLRKDRRIGRAARENHNHKPKKVNFKKQWEEVKVMEKLWEIRYENGYQFAEMYYFMRVSGRSISLRVEC